MEESVNNNEAENIGITLHVMQLLLVWRENFGFENSFHS